MSEPLFRTKTHERNNVAYVRQMVDSGRPKRFHKRITIPITNEMHQKLLKYRMVRKQNKIVREALQQYFDSKKIKCERCGSTGFVIENPFGTIGKFVCEYCLDEEAKRKLKK